MDPLLSCVQVPYLCKAMYDGGDFEDYPSRKGFQIPHIATGNFKHKSREECIGFLQAWMYFGLLWDFFRDLEGFQLSEFIHQNDDGTATVTTRALPHVIRAWNTREQAKTLEERQKTFQQTRSRLLNLHVLAVYFCEGVPAGDGKVRTIELLPPEVSLSIQILADTLQHAGHEILHGNYNIEWGSSTLLQKRMRQVGWCPRAIATCSKGQQIHNLYYASTLGSPPVRKDHSLCDTRVCQWEQIDDASYLTSHRIDCADHNCAWKGPEQSQLMERYARNQTPLVHFDLGADSFTLSESKKVLPYVAISHVCTAAEAPSDLFL